MINSTYFSYDGVFSGTYGLQIAEFDPDHVEENEAFSPSLGLLKVPAMLRFYHGGINYDSAPTCEFKIISQAAIPPEMRAKILSWLVGRNEFKPLKFHNPDWEDYVYYCVFTGSRTIYINGICQGFAVTASFDSPFARGPISRDDRSIGYENFSGTYRISQNLSINNKSTVGDRYVYPKITFQYKGLDRQGTALEIYNSTDSAGASRKLTLISQAGMALDSDEVITIDCELKTITSSSQNVNRYQNLTNKGWVRLLPGDNVLVCSHGGILTVESRNYQMIGY